jgi:hypothetical protein
MPREAHRKEDLKLKHVTQSAYDMQVGLLPICLPPSPPPLSHTDSAEEVWGNVHDFLSFLLITLMRTRRWKF